METIKAIKLALQITYGIFSVILFLTSFDSNNFPDRPINIQDISICTSWLAIGLWINTFRDEPAD